MKVFEKSMGWTGLEYYLVTDNNDEHADLEKSVTSDFVELAKEKATEKLPLIYSLGGKVVTTPKGMKVSFHFRSAADAVANIINRSKEEVAKS